MNTDSKTLQHPTGLLIRPFAPRMTRTLAGMLLAVLLASALPVQAQLGLSQGKEEKIGEEIYRQILAEMPIYQDPGVVDYVNAVGRRLVASSDRPDGNFTFTVIDNPDINAFATPGGYIYIHRGLLGYLRSEAQLAAVLAHEIAHVTARHAARQKRAQTGTNIAAGVLAILSRSGEVGEATALWGAATVRGYGRDMELEADAIGATTMARAGYDRSAIIEVLSLLKDHERFEKQRARDAGREARTYHGLFATHPRNDQRLAEVIASAGNERGGERGETSYRMAMHNLVWGHNSLPATEPDNRFSDDDLGFRFDHPQGWAFAREGNRVRGTTPGGDEGLTLEIVPRTNQTPERFVRDKLQLGVVRKSQSFTQAGMPAYSGVISSADQEQRLTVLYYGRHAYVFRGRLIKGDDGRTEELDTIIRSFAPLPRSRFAGMAPRRIQFVRAANNATWAQLAAHLNLGPYGEQELRLINGHYPRGEPQNGDWIKIIR